MTAPPIKSNATNALVGIWTVVLTTFVIGTLFFARDILIPLALSALLTFLLSPLVTTIERWVGRIAAVLAVVALIFALAGAAGWMLTRQVVDLATKLPEYKDNIADKLHVFRVPESGVFTRFSAAIGELKKELPGGSDGGNPAVTQPAERSGAAPTTATNTPAPVPVQVVEVSPGNPMAMVRMIVEPLLGPLGTAALVLLLVIFMLLQREDLRSRIIRLIGQGHISATTRAMDDAGQRVSRYLLMQLLVNLGYGLIIATGLYFIGVPNAALWGAFGSVLRFIPYIGPWVATIIPTLLALAVSPNWTTPVLTVALFAGIELLLNNVVEPLLYRAHTGVSSIALIVAAVFWTWMWGPLGLVLATPLTVCLVVIGRHVPRLSFLGVVLSDEDALTPSEDCYHRLLTPGERDELELVESYLSTNSVTSLYDGVFIPVLTTAAIDARAELIDGDQLIQVEQSMRDIIDELGTRPFTAPISQGEPVIDAVLTLAPECRVYCVPARAERDEVAGAMLVQLLRQQGFSAQNAPSKLAVAEIIESVEHADIDVVCISVVSPSTVTHARYLCQKLRALVPTPKIVIGLWGVTDDVIESTRRLRVSGADEVVTTLTAALAQVVNFAAAKAAELPRKGGAIGPALPSRSY